MAQIAVLIGEQDERIGKLPVGPACVVIKHNGAFFVRTDRMMKLHHSHRAMVRVYEQTEVYVRDRVEPA